MNLKFSAEKLWWRNILAAINGAWISVHICQMHHWENHGNHILPPWLGHYLDWIQKPKEPSGSFSKFLPLSMKSMTVNELLFKVLQLPPSWLDVCRLESSFDRTEPSPSLPLFNLLLLFFEDMFNSRKSLPTWKFERVNTERHHSLPGESSAPPPFYRKCQCFTAGGNNLLFPCFLQHLWNIFKLICK